MIESYVGAEPFRKGVNAYLQAHAYGNADVAGLLDGDRRRRPANRSISILPTFVNQPGVPLLDVSLTCDAANDRRRAVALTQNRFSLERRRRTQRWDIPVCPKAEGRQAGGACAIVDKAEQVVPLANGCPSVGLHQRRRAAATTARRIRPEMLRALAPRTSRAASRRPNGSVAAWTMNGRSFARGGTRPAIT